MLQCTPLHIIYQDFNMIRSSSDHPQGAYIKQDCIKHTNYQTD